MGSAGAGVNQTHFRPIVHTLFVPHGWELDDVIEELNVFGRLDPGNNNGGEWKVLVCHGSPCVCPSSQPAPDARFYRDGVLTRDLCNDHPRPWVCRTRRWVREQVLRR